MACGNRCCSTACIPNNESWWHVFLSIYKQKWHFCELRKLYNLYSCNHFLVAQPWPCRCDAITVHCLYAQSQVETRDNKLTMIHICFDTNFDSPPKLLHHLFPGYYLFIHVKYFWNGSKLPIHVFWFLLFQSKLPAWYIISCIIIVLFHLHVHVQVST